MRVKAAKLSPATLRDSGVERHKIRKAGAAASAHPGAQLVALNAALLLCPAVAWDLRQRNQNVLPGRLTAWRRAIN